MKLILSTTIFLISILTYSQTEIISSNSIKKGSILLSASSSSNLIFNSTKYVSDTNSNTNKYTYLGLHSSLGYFFIDNLALGASISASNNIQSSNNNSKTYKSTHNSFLVGPLVRYFFPTKTMYPFMSASVMFGSSKLVFDFDEENSYDQKDVRSVMEYSLEAGVAVPISKSINFDVKGYYSARNNKVIDDSDNKSNHTNRFGIHLGFSIILGNE